MGATWGQTRVEVLALRQQIMDRLESGYSVSQIHRELFDAGLISAGLRNFSRQIKPLRDSIAVSSPVISLHSTSNQNISDQTVKSDQAADDMPATAFSPSLQSAIDPRSQVGGEDTAASAAVVPLSGRSRAGGGFTLNRDFNPEE